MLFAVVKRPKATRHPNYTGESLIIGVVRNDCPVTTSTTDFDFSYAYKRVWLALNKQVASSVKWALCDAGSHLYAMFLIIIVGISEA